MQKKRNVIHRKVGGCGNQDNRNLLQINPVLALPDNDLKAAIMKEATNKQGIATDKQKLSDMYKKWDSITINI